MISYRLTIQATQAWSRRRWLACILSLGAWPLLARAAPHPSPSQFKTLRVFVDALLPADALTPAASALGVHTLIMKDADKDPALRLLIQEGVRWLEQSVGELAALKPDQMLRLLNAMSDADWDSGPRNFFYHIRDRAVTHYYADPRAWVGLAIQLPPQPHGYPDAIKP